jgi:hypothetical protein
MVSHVRVGLVNGLCHGLTDGNGLRLSEGQIDDESWPHEVGKQTLTRIHGWERSFGGEKKESDESKKGARLGVLF